MNGLPILLKPYLNLGEAFTRLKELDDGLNKPEDLLLLAENKELKVHLVLELYSDLKLIEARSVMALVKKIPASDYQYDDGRLLEVGLTQEDIDKEKLEIESADWLVVSDDVAIKEFDTPKYFTPKKVNIEANSEELEICDSRYWLSGNPKFEDLSALEIDGVDYFVVKDLTDNPLFLDAERTLEKNGYEGVEYCLDENSIETIIESNSYVVTREELLAYEKRRHDRIKGIAQTKAGRKISTVDVFDLYNSSIARTVQKTNLLELDECERYFQLYAWKRALQEELTKVRSKDYQYEESRTKDITAIKSSLCDIETLLDDRLLVSSDVNSSKNDNQGKTVSKLTTNCQPSNGSINTTSVKNFLNTPKKSSRIYDEFEEAVTQFISDKKRYPRKLELWEGYFKKSSEKKENFDRNYKKHVRKEHQVR